jgi:hypothetical protein
MGHERVGFLPRSKRWSDLVSQMGAVYSGGAPAASIADQTLENVRQRYETLFRDNTVKSIFTFLVTFANACRESDPKSRLQLSNINIPENPTLLSIVKALRSSIPQDQAASEYGQLALAAAADAMGQWQKQYAFSQLPLFQPSSNFFDSWHNLGSGSGFCDLTRLYFGRLTERYLNYFLDRAASDTFKSINQRDQFQHDIKSHIDEISKHAFETAKITQSFAAGWFNKNTREGLPDIKQIEGFLSIAFGKLRDELRREAESK